MNRWIDITVPLRAGMPQWPGDTPFRIHRALDQAKGDICTLSDIEMSVHTGTHMDAPRHFLPNGTTMEHLPLDATVGPARVIPIQHPKAIHRDELLPHNIQRGERILFHTANSDRLWNTDTFAEDFIFIAKDAAEYLADRRIGSVGVDYLSVGGFHQDLVETHEALLRVGIWIMEGLNLNGIEPGPYDLICLPLKLVGSDGAPARAIIRRRVE